MCAYVFVYRETGARARKGGKNTRGSFRVAPKNLASINVMNFYAATRWYYSVTHFPCHMPFYERALQRVTRTP